MKEYKLSKSEYFETVTEEQAAISAMYTLMASRFKKKGSNFTPPKKKRKKK